MLADFKRRQTIQTGQLMVSTPELWERSVANAKADMQRHREAAVATFAKDSRINIRISSKDLRALQKKALGEGLPYQTLIASVLHKYIEGRLQEAR